MNCKFYENPNPRSPNSDSTLQSKNKIIKSTQNWFKELKIGRERKRIEQETSKIHKSEEDQPYFSFTKKKTEKSRDQKKNKDIITN